jgi:hypothetical protein
MSLRIRKLDDVTNWSGTFNAILYRILVDNQDSEPRTQEYPISYTIEKIGKAAYKVIYTYLGITEEAIGLSFEFCDTTRVLILVDISDDSELTMTSSKIDGATVLRFQTLFTEPSSAPSPSNPAFVGFSTADRIVI